MERQECVEQEEAILSFCAGVAGAGCARAVAGGWSCNTNGWARLRLSSPRHGRSIASHGHTL